jgi:hypothetical protein
MHPAAHISTTSAAARTYYPVDAKPYASARLSYRGVPEPLDGGAFLSYHGEGNTNLNAAADIFLDAKYGVVSADGGMHTRYPATHRSHNVSQMPTVRRQSGDYTRYHVPATIINEYPIEMSVMSYDAGTAMAVAAVAAVPPQHDPGSSSASVSHTTSGNISSDEILDAVVYSNRKPTSRYNSDYACTVLRVETWRSGQIVVFYSARGSLKCGALPPPTSSCLVTSEDTVYHPLWHDNLLHVSDKASGYELREGVLGFTSIKSDNKNDSDRSFGTAAARRGGERGGEGTVQDSLPEIEDVVPNALDGLPAMVSFVYGGRDQPNERVWWSLAALRVYSDLTTWRQRKSALRSQSLGVANGRADGSQGSSALPRGSSLAITGSGLAGSMCVTGNSTNGSSSGGSSSIARVACPQDGTTELSVIRRRPKLWRKQDYAYHSEDKELDREITMIHKSVKLRRENGIPRPKSALMVKKAARRHRRGRQQGVAPGSTRKKRPNTFGGGGGQGAFIPKPPIYTQRRRARSAYGGYKVRTLVYPSQFRVGPPSSGKQRAKTGLAAGLAGIEPVYPPQPYNYLPGNEEGSDGAREGGEGRDQGDMRTTSEIEAAGSIFGDDPTEGSGSGSLKLRVNIGLGESHHNNVITVGNDSNISDDDNGTGRKGETIWRRAAEGFAEAVLTRSIVALRAASRRARAELREQAGEEKQQPRKQRQQGRNIVGAIPGAMQGDASCPSYLGVYNVEFRGEQDHYRHQGGDVRVSATSRSGERWRSAGVAMDEEGGAEKAAASPRSASPGAVSRTGSTPAPVLEEFTEDGNLVIRNPDYQVVFELDAWIKDEAEAEDRRNMVLAANAKDPEKLERLRALYSVDRERALAQLSNALPSVIGELFGDIPVGESKACHM